MTNMFSIKKPCKDCPFRKDGNMIKSLGKVRMEEIVSNIVYGDDFFSCHKTVDYSKDEKELNEENKFCAGALIAIHKAGTECNNKNSRIALMFDLYKPEELKDKDEVINPEEYRIK